ncbi:hypothetical protein KSD_61640 [Ktedonobacter sp. SOSP1-85]|uniref:class IV adenylate cyclase n=1 Tax=Ktedonobacter sp. SOSP1-85 TaxID=2778367 RepID=UPI0019166B35|nr:CYTH domain-containing protein [Ktedonobacter sp. SOSP1-85]GHO78393.1 hypothetical protein KSD_61640 [Ktedonobacter sp. SOSP1-85]
MRTEYEATFPDVDLEEIRQRLKQCRARLEREEFLQKRYVFDLPEGQDIPGAWLRLRHEGDRITLTLKAITGQAIELQQELEIEVNDFEQTSVLLSMLGCRRRAYQESKRELWDLDGVQITLDTWPFLEPFVEVEGPSEQTVRDACAHLQLPYEEAIFGSIDQLYARRYNISREVITRQISNLAFTEDSCHEFNHYINQ